MEHYKDSKTIWILSLDSSMPHERNKDQFKVRTRFGINSVFVCRWECISQNVCKKSYTVLKGLLVNIMNEHRQYIEFGLLHWCKSM